MSLHEGKYYVCPIQKPFQKKEIGSGKKQYVITVCAPG